MADYSKGVLDSGTGVGTDFLWQSRGVSMESDENIAKENKGNAKDQKFYNHRLKVKIEAIIPVAGGVSVPGQTITLTNVVAPTVTLGVVSGTFGVGTGSVKFYVEPGVEITETNTDYNKVSIELIRYLNNALPA
jgi:hypothetical protein